jgi:hypothetical protein
MRGYPVYSLKWDGHNREHIRRHAVSSWEVEDAIRDVRGTAGIWRCITAREENDFEKKRFFG